MAIRLDASTDNLSRNSGSLSGSVFTVLGWVKLAVDRNTWQALFAWRISTNSPYLLGIVCNATGTQTVLYHGGETALRNLTVGVWYAFALVKDGTTATAYIRAAGETSWTSVQRTGIGATLAADTIWFGMDHFSEWFNGSFAGCRIWSGVALSADLLLAESYSLQPRRWANLWYWNPLLNHANAAVDFSGAGNGFTANGTLATEDGPPVPWRGGGWGGMRHAASGGSALSASHSDGLALVDSEAAAAAFARALADATALGDNFAPVSTFARALSEAVALGEANAAALVIVREIADALSLADATARVAAFARVHTEAVILAEVLGGSTAFARALGDALALGDAAARAAAFVRAATDALALGEANTASLVLVRAIADALALDDGTAAVAIFARAFADAVALADGQATVTAFGRAISEGLSIAEAVAHASAYARAHADALAILEALATGEIPAALAPWFVVDRKTGLVSLRRNTVTNLTKHGQAGILP